MSKVLTIFLASITMAYSLFHLVQRPTVLQWCSCCVHIFTVPVLLTLTPLLLAQLPHTMIPTFHEAVRLPTHAAKQGILPTLQRNNVDNGRWLSR